MISEITLRASTALRTDVCVESLKSLVCSFALDRLVAPHTDEHAECFVLELSLERGVGVPHLAERVFRLGAVAEVEPVVSDLACA